MQCNTRYCEGLSVCLSIFLSVCLSVCQMCAWWQNERNLCTHSYTYEGRPINKLQNGIILKNPKYRFLHNLIGHIYWNFYEYYVIIMTSRVHRTQSVVQYFTHSFTTCQVLNVIVSYEYQKMNAFSNETCLNVKHQPYIFQHIVQIYLNTYWYTPVRTYERCDCCDRCISRWNNTSARSFFINNTFSSTSKLLTPNMYCRSCKTLHHILDASQSEWYLGNVFLPRENE